MSELVRSRVIEALDVLRLNTVKANLDQRLHEAQQRELSVLSVLDNLPADELAARKERSIFVRTKLAHFPVLRTLDSFDFEATLSRSAPD